MAFSFTLSEIRKKYFPGSAKKAWETWKKRGLDVNYPYYMRLEQGKAVPSAEVVSQIAQNLVQSDREKLILSYCQALFPAEKNLFAKSQLAVPLQKTDKKIEGSKAQKELKLRQIQVLAEHKSNYQIFVILLLARDGVEIVELQKKYESRSLVKVLKALEQENLIYEKDRRIFAVHTDVRFPDASQVSVQKMYLQFDQWDRELSQDFRFEKLFKRKFVRRVSTRYLQILTQQLDLISDIVKSADEVDARFNDEVVQLELSLHRGRVPG